MLDLKATLLAILSVVLLAVCASCAKPSDLSDGFVTSDAMHDWLAFANWGCGNEGPIIFYRERLMDAVLDNNDRGEALATRAHERDHIALAKSFDSCAEWNAFRAVPRNKRIIEAMAHCAEVESRVEQGGDRAYWFAALAKEFRERSEWRDDMTLYQARTIMALYCEAAP